MGVSIDLHVFDYDKLVDDINQWVTEKGGAPEGRSVAYFRDAILPQFGLRDGDKFYVLWNEYYEDYNAGSELLTAVALYFKKDAEDTPWFDYEIGNVNANAYEVLSSILGDDFDEEDDE